MDREALKRQAASRRESPDVADPVKSAKWACEFCGHSFVHETMFMRHRCREKLRIEELRSPIGTAAYSFYGEWMRRKLHSVPPIETFAESRLYTTFVKFAKYAERTNLPSTSQFIKLMVDHDISPTLWSRDSTYAMYLQWMDELTTPEQQVLDSFDFVTGLASDLECSPNEVWTKIQFATLVKHLTRRKISPWLALSSPSFRTFMMSLEPVKKEQLQNAVREGAMVDRIMNNRQLFADFNKFAREVGL